MNRIIIETEDKEVLNLLMTLAKNTKVKVIDESITRNTTDTVKLMNEIAASVSLTTIKDPVAWQREIRKDRKLPFRD